MPENMNEEIKTTNLKKITRYVEKLIIHALIVMMAGVLILATIELGYFLISTIIQSRSLLINLDNLLDLFGIFLLVLIGIELLDTIKVYFKENVVHVEVVVLVAIIAIARKVVILKAEELPGETLLGIAAILVALAVTYFLIRKAGLCEFDLTEKKFNEHKTGNKEIITPDEVEKYRNVWGLIFGVPGLPPRV
jgi:uncharacterized membrane protein (DUF373 family)